MTTKYRRKSMSAEVMEESGWCLAIYVCDQNDPDSGHFVNLQKESECDGAVKSVPLQGPEKMMSSWREIFEDRARQDGRILGSLLDQIMDASFTLGHEIGRSEGVRSGGDMFRPLPYDGRFE